VKALEALRREADGLGLAQRQIKGSGGSDDRLRALRLSSAQGNEQNRQQRLEEI
jgi:hypothetical protein